MPSKSCPNLSFPCYTLEELRVLLHEKTQITISRATIARYTSRLKYTVKKNFTPN